MLLKANLRKGSDGSPVVSLDGIDSSSVHSADLAITASSTSSPEPYATTPSPNRPSLTGTELYFVTWTSGQTTCYKKISHPF